MKTWQEKFQDKHGERLYFMRIMFLMGLIFFSVGSVFVYSSFMMEVGTGLIGSGVTLLGQVAGIAANKARSPGDKPE